MNPIKQSLFKASPSLYFYLRDLFQNSKLVASGTLKETESQNQDVNDFESAHQFSEKWLKSYQVKSEISDLIRFLKERQPKTYVEIGTANGGTHYFVRKLCDSITTSVAIDTDIRNKLILEKTTSTPTSYYLCGSSGSQKILNKFRAIFPEKGMVDVLFIDGDHSYNGVKSDFEIYRPEVRKGGIIIFHDIVEDWQQRYGKETNKYTGGVPQFFSEIKENYKHMTFVEDENQDGFGIGVIITDD